MPERKLIPILAVVFLGGAATTASTKDDVFPSRVLESVVSVLPEWPDPGSRLEVPEGSAVAILPGGYLATNVQLLGRAESVKVRFNGGRVLRSRSGLRVTKLNDEERFTLSGARIRQVKGAAAAAGDVITAIDGRRILKPADVISAVNLRRPGDTLIVAYVRDGETAQARLELP